MHRRCISEDTMRGPLGRLGMATDGRPGMHEFGFAEGVRCDGEGVRPSRLRGEGVRCEGEGEGVRCDGEGARCDLEGVRPSRLRGYVAHLGQGVRLTSPSPYNSHDSHAGWLPAGGPLDSGSRDACELEELSVCELEGS
jgi:hypothetical protein